MTALVTSSKKIVSAVGGGLGVLSGLQRRALRVPKWERLRFCCSVEASGEVSFLRGHLPGLGWKQARKRGGGDAPQHWPPVSVRLQVVGKCLQLEIKLQAATI